jgi:hypothetical protein
LAIDQPAAEVGFLAAERAIRMAERYESKRRC